MTRTRPRTGLATGLFALCVAALILAILVVWLPGRAAADPGGACFTWEEHPTAEYSRTVVVTEEVVELEHQLAKFTRERTKDRGGWSEWSEPVLWEPLSHETWVTEIPEPTWQPHHRSPGLQRDWALLPTGYADTVVVSPEVTETETVWSAEHPGEGWEPTGATDVEIVHVEVPCPVEEPPVEQPPVEVPPVEDPHVCPTGDGHTVGVDPYAYDDCPPIDTPVESEPEPTSEPPSEVEVVPVAAVEQPRTLPRTGIKEDIASVGLVLLFVGGSLLIVGRHDRKHT